MLLNGHVVVVATEAQAVDRLRLVRPVPGGRFDARQAGHGGRHPDGSGFNMNEGLSAFDEFGVEVAGYMRFLTYTGRVFWVALLLNLSNIIQNLDGARR